MQTGAKIIIFIIISMKHTNDNKCDVVLTFITSIIIITVKIGIDKSPREVACTFFCFLQNTRLIIIIPIKYKSLLANVNISDCEDVIAMVLSGIILIYGINITKNSHAEVIAASKIL